ncbi:nuclear transport factor 2 family protein [Haloplanus sp. GCM10025708]|uniref:nuclear transport factor 2 family protein n=1 Tax=Haloferacaceae TaxID=1644056 RepID=UPI003610E0BE
MTTEDVLDHHLDAFVAQDLDGIMEDYADDSFVVTPMGTFRGLDEIEELFAGLFEEFARPGTDITLDQQTVEGDWAYIVWHAETQENVYEYCTDTFEIRGGEIRKQTFAGKITPKE